MNKISNSELGLFLVDQNRKRESQMISVWCVVCEKKKTKKDAGQKKIIPLLQLKRSSEVTFRACLNESDKRKHFSNVHFDNICFGP